ncbi:MAG: Ppx/GppA family phosphatase [Rhodospirillales bacterium]|nr:Ppx/GppA family phosphatase [Rhodospirillales bacterium]
MHNGGRRSSGKWGRKGHEGNAPAFSAIDLGTHNCRMLIAVPTRHGFKVIDSFSRTVRLGEDVTESGNLCDVAVDRTVEALSICAEKMERCKVVNSRNIATAACRGAANCDGFVDKVREKTGIEIEIIPAEEEARLTLAGCSPLLNDQKPYALVFDIGGGSTEVAWTKVNPNGSPEVLDVISICSGVVTFCERFGGDFIKPEVYATMSAEIRAELEPFEKKHNINAEIAAGTVQMLGTSGTVTTLGAAYLELPFYNRSRVDGLELDFSDVFRVSNLLAGTDFKTRAANGCIGPTRADLVVSGCAILDAVCTLWPVGKLRIADRGIREGLLHELISANKLKRQKQRARRRRYSKQRDTAKHG